MATTSGASRSFSTSIGSEAHQKTVKENPVIIGLYGLPGSGKSTLLKQLSLGTAAKLKSIVFLEGSDLIRAVVPSGRTKFRQLFNNKKEYFRELAIETARKICVDEGKIVVVTGNYMFWDEKKSGGERTWTKADGKTFSHILYLDVPAEEIAQRRLNDTTCVRPKITTPELSSWQETEKAELRSLCKDDGILFSVLPFSSNMEEVITPFLEDFGLLTEKQNLQFLYELLEEQVNKIPEPAPDWMVIATDTDGTLTPQDTGKMMWKDPSLQTTCPPRPGDVMINEVFSGPMGHSYKAFRQAALIYGEAFDDKDYDACCKQVASEVELYPAILPLIKWTDSSEQATILVITCGQEKVWKQVLQNQAPGCKVVVMGSGRGSNALVITPEIKASLVSYIQEVGRFEVLAFGNSPLDMPMMKVADEAFIIVGDKETRSKSMDDVLAKAITEDGFWANQVLMTPNATPRLDTTEFPTCDIADQEFRDEIMSRPKTNVVHYARDHKAKLLLMTRTRDAGISGPALREAHRQLGYFVAIDCVADVIGLEEYDITHVQGHTVPGYRLKNESSTIIAAIMRSGEPMAFGVNDAFPSAMFLHVKTPEDIQAGHIQGKKAIILVDSVINTGKTVTGFLERVYALDKELNLGRQFRIFVVTGVLFIDAIPTFRKIREASRSHTTVAALRISHNSFTGKGSTDTGNRLFNTTHLE
ncbi:hypothetical protein PV10_07346 [Exophiala mesophila]|uniref:Phosphoribosyltransferase domain-containing protein n=1 Tax=Exophiala mesophila TaxID=212818 RepID=A0A0D1XPI1_EXOME|nr:uncharacterized protein PV10_07346 [Exophiala mesophila]KIV89996.1 hypothetical protein PV10_07346 [Exophiala mesophila]